MDEEEGKLDELIGDIDSICNGPVEPAPEPEPEPTPDPPPSE